MTDTDRPTEKAPSALLFVFATLFLGIAVTHLLALRMTFVSWNWLRAFEIAPGTTYLVYKNIFFALGFLIAAIALLFRKRWAPLYSSILSVLMVAWFWLDRTILNQSPLPFSQHWFLLVLTFLSLGLTLVSMVLLVPCMRQKKQVLPPLELNDETQE
jgi:hypothetical protein